MKKKFLITGVGGFVADYLIEYLYAAYENIEVLGIDIAETFQLPFKNFRYKKINLLDRPATKTLLMDVTPDYIIHLASISSVAKSWTSPVESFQNNTNIFLNILESARELGLKSRILSIGSSEEYGAYEASAMPLKEEYELHPNNPYSVARVAQEMLSKLYANSYGIDVIMTRSFNHIGPKQSDMFVIPSFVKQLVEISQRQKLPTINVGNVEVVRDFLDVRDVVVAYHKILTEGKTGEVYNVCSGNGVKLRDIIEKVGNLLGLNVKLNVDNNRIRPNETMLIVGDNSKIKKDLGWAPSIPIEKTLHDMIEYQSSKLT